MEFNRVPNKPSSLQVTNPVQPACSTSQQQINSKTPTLSAIVSDPDGTLVAPHFQVYTKSGTTETEVWNSTTLAAQASGTRAQATVAPGKLVENTGYSSYFWRATSVDTGGRWSGWSVSCEFKVDITPPGKPTVTAVGSGAGIEAVYEPDVERGGVGLLGKFTLKSPNDYDVKFVEYWFTGETPTLASVTPGSSLEIPHDPKGSGPMTLHAKARDGAGNWSAPFDYTFDVASPVEDVIWKLDENNGSSAADSGPKDAGPLGVTGAGWVAGPHQLFGSRDDDWALSFDGVNDAAISGGPVLDTSKSFTVSAHVLLNKSTRGQGDYTALSQDGLTQSAFRLGYRSNCGNGTDCWSFGMPDTSAGTSVTAATSSAEVTDGQWVHLVGEHDATAKTVRLWVCEVGTPDQSATGEPIGSAPIARGGAAWQSPGAFAVGRGQTAGAGATWWPGQIDNVRLFSGQITDAAKLRRLCKGAEIEDFGEGVAAFNAIDPTVSEQ
ncbi:LamG domain-containing protein [Agromyces sp. ISL-38]|uniref:LamG domain-containing protein n=1 Tax=Agromyces sp. ISL-38 TaxID=2819107 RepID=UPI001BE7740B|nr:LamG domain-containing protein [Agromyces sp. ISL-38]MBT2500170.1 LamG domain-containing protein [Agromyces sp. ISL-38]